MYKTKIKTHPLASSSEMNLWFMYREELKKLFPLAFFILIILFGIATFLNWDHPLACSTIWECGG